MNKIYHLYKFIIDLQINMCALVFAVQVKKSSYSPLEDNEAPSSLVSFCAGASQLVGSMASTGTSSLRLSISSSGKKINYTNDPEGETENYKQTEEKTQNQQQRESKTWDYKINV